MNVYEKRITEMKKLRTMYSSSSEEYRTITDAIKEQEQLGGIGQPISTLNVDQQSRSCQCGARHTAFPQVHMNYCPMKQYK